MQTIALIVTIILAFIGYIVTYFNNLLLARRKERLDLINRKLNDFYGPLYVISCVGKIAYNSLIEKLKKHDDPDLRKPLTEQELAEWRLWMINVFMPLNKRCEKIILENAYLIEEKAMPECLLKFVTHISAFKAVIKKWEQRDHSEHFSLIDYPEELIDYASRSYSSLKAGQLRLIGKLKYRT